MSSKMLHPCLRVENLEKVNRFYQDAFGFEEKRRKDFPDYKVHDCFIWPCLEMTMSWN